MGVEHVTIMHTRDRKQADSPEFVAPLKEATGVWVTGGKDAYLMDTYVGTKVETEMKALLARGGVVAGTSAGAVLLGSQAIEGSYVDSAGTVVSDFGTLPMGTAALRVEWTHAGWGLLTNSAIMPHWSERRRPDFAAPLASYPGLLGLAIDEDAAAVVRGTRLEVIGNGQLAIYDGKVHGDKLYFLLSPGDRFDLHTRSPISTR
jgi:cyanophycinase